MLGLTKEYQLPPLVVVMLLHGFVDPQKNNFIQPKGELAQELRLFKFVGDELEANGFYVVDPLPYFQKYSGMAMAISEWEPHPNYLSHYIYAQSIFDGLIQQRLISHN